MKKLFYLLALCYGQPLLAQSNPFMNDGNGRPLYLKTNYVADGSPYFFEEYNLAEITTTSGRVYSRVRAKINLLDNQVQYMTDKDEELVTTLPLKRIKFYQVPDENNKPVSITLESFGDMLNSAGAPIYQVIDSGRVLLLKKTELTYRDEKKYGEATITRHFERKETDYLMLPTREIKKIEKGKAFMLEALADKQKEVSEYIDQNTLKCRNTEQYRQVIHYYNSL